MMEICHISPSVYFITEDERSFEFILNRDDNEKKPSREECKGSLKGVYLAHAGWSEQEHGIEPMAEKFGATDDNQKIIKRIPKELKIIESEGVKAIKYGNQVKLNSMMVKITMVAGIIGYWNDKNFIICASPEYEFVIDSIRKMVKPNQTCFAFDQCFGYMMLWKR